MSNSWERWNVAPGLEVLEDSAFKPLESSPGEADTASPADAAVQPSFHLLASMRGLQFSLPDGCPCYTVVTFCFRLDGDTYHMHALEKVLLFLASCFISFQKVDDLLIRKSILFHLVVRRY